MWVAPWNLAPILLFISFGEFCECIFGKHITSFESKKLQLSRFFLSVRYMPPQIISPLWGQVFFGHAIIKTNGGQFTRNSYNSHVYGCVQVFVNCLFGRQRKMHAGTHVNPAMKCGHQNGIRAFKPQPRFMYKNEFPNQRN